MSAILTALLFVILSEGVGAWVIKLLHSDINGFAAPVGTAVIFSALELLYLPRLLLGGPIDWVKGATMIILIATVAITLGCYQEVTKKLWRGRTVYVLLSAALLSILFALCATKIPFESDPELIGMISNFDTRSIEIGPMWLQGYQVLGACVAWMFDGSFMRTSLMLGLYANMIAVMLALNMIDSFRIGNPWFRFTLIIGSVFYTQFYGWKITGSYHGGNWRIFFTAQLLFALYQWLKTGDEKLKYLIPFIIGGGLFAHNGFLMVGFELMYCTAVYLFHIKKIRGLYDVTTFIIPLLIYTSCWLSQFSTLAGWIFFLVCLVFTLARYKRKVYHRIIQIENLCIDYCWSVFIVAIPLIFLVGSFVMRFFTVNYGVLYSDYLHFFSSAPVKAFLFMNASVLDIVLDIFRWGGVLVFVMRAEQTEERLIRAIFFGMVVFFVNPLCMGMLSEITGLEMYAYAFEILFNPFTDIMIFYWIYRQFEWTVIGQWVLELSLIVTAVLGHVTSFAQMKSGLYTELIDRDHIIEVIKP